MMNQWTTFKEIHEIFHNVINKVETTDNMLEKLCEIGSIVKPTIFATGIQLAESGSVKKILIDNSVNRVAEKRSKNRNKPRKFENFADICCFDERPIESDLKNKQLKNYTDDMPSFLEVENCRNSGSMRILFPNVHFCTCPYFKNVVLNECKDWTCCHIIAAELSKYLNNPTVEPCGVEMSNILRKVVLRPYLNENRS